MHNGMEGKLGVDQNVALRAQQLYIEVGESKE